MHRAVEPGARVRSVPPSLCTSFPVYRENFKIGRHPSAAEDISPLGEVCWDTSMRLRPIPGSVPKPSRALALMSLAAMVSLTGLAAETGVAFAATQTLAGSLTLSNNQTGASGIQDTIIAQQTSGTSVSFTSGSVVVAFPSAQTLPTSVADVTTENIPSPGTITISGDTVTIPFTGTLSTGTQVTVIVSGISNGSTPGSLSATITEENSAGTSEASGTYTSTLATSAIQATVVVAEALAMTAVSPTSAQLSVDPQTVTSATQAIGGINVLSDASGAAVTVSATTPTDASTTATFPWAATGDGLAFEASTSATYLALGTAGTTVDTLTGPTGSGGVTVTGILRATDSWSTEAGVYTTTLTFGASPTY